MRGAWIRYRIMAYLVGTLLVVLVLVGLPLKYWLGNPDVVTWTAIPHGYLYMVLLITAIDLGRRARWSWLRLLLIALAAPCPSCRSSRSDPRPRTSGASWRPLSRDRRPPRSRWQFPSPNSPGRRCRAVH